MSLEKVKELSLFDLVLMFFDETYKQLNKKYEIAKDVHLYGDDGREKFKFDLVVVDLTSHEKIGVWIKDWRRPVGIDVFTRFKRAINKTKLTMGFLFANRLANILQHREKENVFVLHRGELVSILRKLGALGSDGSRLKLEDIMKEKFDI